MKRYGNVTQTLCIVTFLSFYATAWIIDLAPVHDEEVISQTTPADTPWLQDVVVIKVGGSSITNKAIQESLNETALDWFSATLAAQMHDYFVDLQLPIGPPTCPTNTNTASKKSAFVIIHGAGSFGHHVAKQYDLKGQFAPPPPHSDSSTSINETLRNRQRQGLAQTRLSVRTLNHHIVSNLLKHGIHAVGISPCFSIPNMQAHGGSSETIQHLQQLIYITLQAGLIPVLHGDACLYGTKGVGILSGDTLMEMVVKTAPWVSRAVFLTDVDGVHTSDPKTNPNAELLKTIQVDVAVNGTLSVALNLDASGSSHEHDVTGGLKVCIYVVKAVYSKCTLLLLTLAICCHRPS
jgi:isopentenyl phosphate kinase